MLDLEGRDRVEGNLLRADVSRVCDTEHPRIQTLTEWRFTNLLELLRLYADFYCETSHRLGMWSMALGYTDPPEVVREALRGTINHLTALKKECGRLGLEATEDKISCTLETWNRSQIKRNLISDCTDVTQCLCDELKRRVCLIVPRSAQELYESPLSGWDEILRVFPDATDDVAEMNRCRALGREAASVFHVLLVVEQGIVELGQFIGVTDKKPGWDATYQQLEKVLHDGRNKVPRKLKKHFSFLELVNKDIHSMKMAWRNKVNHAAGKLVVMTSDFKPQVADKIISACHGFMLLLATEGPLTK